MMSSFFESVRNIVTRRELLAMMIARDVRQRYLRTSLGLLWIVLQPLLLLSFYTFVFSVVFRVRVDVGGLGGGGPFEYMIFVLGALLPWLAFSEGTTRAAQSLLGHASVITKVAFPVELLPLSAVGAAFVSLSVTLSVLLLALLILGKLTGAALILPLLALFLGMTALGFGYFLSVLNAFVRDVSHVMSFVFSLWLYASPVLYPAHAVPESFRFVLELNPIVPILTAFRAVLVYGVLPTVGELARAAAVAFFASFFGLALFARAKRLYSEIL
jgi:lipopolysaccharide transport system permease protein